MAVLLYYPLVRPPAEVLHQALLYWDGIGSVVPTDPEVYEVAVPPELRDLRDRSLYTPLRFGRGSMDLLADPDWGAAFDGTQASEVLREELLALASGPNRPRLPSPPEAFLYSSKLSWWLEEELLRLGLAERDRSGYWSLAVPREVRHLVVGVLARELAARGDVPYIPYTDRPEAYEASLRAAPTQRPLAAFQADLSSLLPVPAPGTTVAEVLAFRERHSDERERLMRALHRLLGDLRRDYEHPADVLAQLRREVEQSVEDYHKAAKSSRMAWVERSVTVTVALAAAAASVAQPGLSWVLGAVGGYALNVATREIRPLARAREDHDFSYLHRVRGALG
ncbi:hypothetical protein [Streptomyces sp. T028]|uniref:hypothetical protein n=1 Tax=Streptomyces sp. T028 TaxID=3394379 RepID=UPI003A88583E